MNNENLDRKLEIFVHSVKVQFCELAKAGIILVLVSAIIIFGFGLFLIYVLIPFLSFVVPFEMIDSLRNILVFICISWILWVLLK